MGSDLYKLGKSLGFKYQVVEATFLEVKLPEPIYFKYIETENVHSEIEFLIRPFGGEVNFGSNLGGHCCSILENERMSRNTGLHFVIINSSLNSLDYIYNVGHEFGHLIHNLGHQSLIYDRFSRITSLKNKHLDTESFAHMCGILALDHMDHLGIVPINFLHNKDKIPYYHEVHSFFHPSFVS